MIYNIFDNNVDKAAPSRDTAVEILALLCEAAREHEAETAQLKEALQASEAKRAVLEASNNELQAELAAERAKTVSSIRGLEQQVKDMAADMELQRSDAASTASTIADLQQQLKVVETAFYLKHQDNLTWADQADLAAAEQKAERLEFKLRQVEAASQRMKADLRSQGTTDTALSMARALQVEVNFWQSKRSMQCKNRNGTQRGGSSSSSTWHSW